MDDRFSFGAELEEEPLTEDQGTNRVFTIIAIGLVGLILLGLLGIGGYMIIIRPSQQEKRASQATEAFIDATAVAQATALAPTDTPWPTDTPVPTNTPLPTPTPKATNTRVIPATATPEPGAVPTPTRTPIGGPRTPQTGISGLGAVLAAAALVVVAFVARKLRLAS